MSADLIKHYPTCNPNYPEKIEREGPRSTTLVPIGGGEGALTCNDCGAYVIVPCEEDL